jgi:uncharacterized surface protein with fasciclin (FAS1) repeats
MQFKNAIQLLFIFCLAQTVSAQKYLSVEKAEITKEWEGNDFNSSKTLMENIADASQFTIFTKLLKDERLRENLEKNEMVTIFIFTDESFLELPKKSRDSILGNPLITQKLVKHLSVPGRMDQHSLKMAVLKNGGKAYLSTLSGESLGVREVNGELQLVDSDNRIATFVASDFYHKNGFFHIVNGLIFPETKE